MVGSASREEHPGKNILVAPSTVDAFSRVQLVLALAKIHVIKKRVPFLYPFFSSA